MNEGFLKGLLKRIKLNESTISMFLGALVVVVIGALIFNYFSGIEKTEEEFAAEEQTKEVRLIENEGEKLAPEGLPKAHTVALGENLWEIAEKYYGSGYNWVDIASENQLADPDQLAVGQELTIPKAPVISDPVIKMTEFGPSITGSQYTVQENEHLWGIAVRAYGDGYQWSKIAKANGLADPDLIHAGNVLTIPR